MRILHTSDWHLGRKLEGKYRYDEQKNFVDEICNLAEAKDVHLVIIAGDVYDSVNPPAEAENIYYAALERLSGKRKRSVVVISGNHDNPERLCAAEPLAANLGVTLAGKPGEILLEDAPGEGVRRIKCGKGWVELQLPLAGCNASIVLLPYPNEVTLNEVLSPIGDEKLMQQAYSKRVEYYLNTAASEAFSPQNVNIIVSHLFVLGGIESEESERPIQLGGAYTVYPQNWPANCNYVALGHLHRAQQISHPSIPIYYSGATLSHTFGEAVQAKSVYLVDVEPKSEIKVEEIVLTAGKPLLEIEETKGVAECVTLLQNSVPKEAWINLQLKIERPLTPDELLKLRSAHPGLLRITTPSIQQENSSDSHIGIDKMPIELAFKHFYSQLKGYQPRSEILNLFNSLLEESGDEAL